MERSFGALLEYSPTEFLTRIHLIIRIYGFNDARAWYYRSVADVGYTMAILGRPARVPVSCPRRPG